MKKFISIFILLILICSCEDHNQNNLIVPGNPNTSFHRKILDGYFVTSIAFDHKGNAWIGTFKQGLIKYNSFETKVYDWHNSTIPENGVINDIAIDSHDNVWIGCEGLIKFDGSRFISFNSENSPIPEDFVYSIAIDSKDNVWFTSCRFRTGGLVKYDGFHWEVFTPLNSDLPVNYIRSIAVDRNDNVWLALSEIVNEASLVKISGSLWATYTRADLGFTPYYFTNIEFNSRNQLCGGIDYSLSSSVINAGPQVFIFNGHDSEEFTFNNAANVKSITVDDEDNIWCASTSGYAVYNGENWIVDDSTFRQTGVFAIEQDRNKKIWIGTGNGVYTSY
jgi:ligand-binding sensor domain-containing protein